MNTAAKLQQRLGLQFSDLDLLQTAVVHRSYLNENRGFKLPHNERLEFLGDAVLELIVTEHLYRTYDNPEGELTSWRSALVRGDMLAKLAERFELGQAMLMSRGEEKSGGRTRSLLLANAFEAIIGATYLDQGYEGAKAFVHKVIIPELPAIIEGDLHVDAKSSLQEKSQESFNQTPRYEVIQAIGPDHDKRFTVAVHVGDNKLAEGAGTSKQSAEQAAAETALKGWPPDLKKT